jgi:hypothetical protein
MEFDRHGGVQPIHNASFTGFYGIKNIFDAVAEGKAQLVHLL